jgi:hypothetical protein
MANAYNANIADASVTANGFTAATTGKTKMGTQTDGTLRFIPILWSSKINEQFYAQTVLGDITNNNYIGELSSIGDKVIIMNSPTIAIADYTIGSELSYQRPPVEKTEVSIDYALQWNYQVNDVERAQTKADYMSAFSKAAGEQLKVKIDKDVMGRIFNDAHTKNKGATAGVVSSALNLGATGLTCLKVVSELPGTPAATDVTPYDLITRLSAVLDEQNVPESDRWMIVPPLFRTRLAGASTNLSLIQGGDEALYRNGKFGQIDRFAMYVSNLLPAGAAGETYIMAGHKSAVCYASTINKVETLRNPRDFGDLVRGLCVYGHKVIKPESLAVACVKFS